mmetsp:Transcript_10750/g.10870  ORF Transcript_10750/g.10870 Transcript_10750/m.10870 type:complete len:176 (+) Transcript_10750:22-549(+)
MSQEEKDPVIRDVDADKEHANCDHDHDHDHDHDDDGEEMPALENQDGDKKGNLNRGEKKCRKALLKLGMKQVAGINRVTLKKRDGLIFVINDPEVLKNGANDNSYAVFGELKLEDPNTKMAEDKAKKFIEKEGEGPKATGEDDQNQQEEEKKKVGEEEGPLSEEGLTQQHIEMVM